MWVNIKYTISWILWDIPCTDLFVVSAVPRPPGAAAENSAAPQLRAAPDPAAPRCSETRNGKLRPEAVFTAIPRG